MKAAVLLALVLIVLTTGSSAAPSPGAQEGAFQAINENVVYVLGDGVLWREYGKFDNAQHPRVLVDANVRAFEAISENIVYVLGTDGVLWREYGTFDNKRQPRVQVDANVGRASPAASLSGGEINLTAQGTGPMEIKPGAEYLVLKTIGTNLDYKWAIWGNGPFEFKVKGIRALKVLGITVPVPNPFNTEWSSSVSSFGGHRGVYGVNATDSIVTHYVLIRSSQPVSVRVTGLFTGHGGINVKF
jgi:hypothetical protein